MPLLTTVDTVRIDLPAPGEWVDVKSRLSAGERQRIAAASFRLRAGLPKNGNVPEGEMELQYEAAAFASLEVGIQAWSFDVPVSPAAIRQLDGDSYDAIVARLNTLWAPRTEAEKNG